MPERERAVEAHLVKALAKIGYPCIKFIPDDRKGMPDRLVLLPDSRVVWVELKTVGGVLSEMQKYRHSELRRLGQRVEVVWTVAQADALADELRRDYDTTRSCVTQ